METKLTLVFADADDTAYAMAASPDFARDGVCFAACASGLYRSRDGGFSWELLRTSTAAVMTAVALSPAFAADHSVFAAVKGGVLRSSDGGDTWFTAGFPAPPPLFSALVVSPDFERDGCLLAATLEDGVFASNDRGLRWQPWNFGLFDLAALCLALSPAWTEDETAYAGCETGLYRSANGGRAWRPTGFPAERAPVLSVVCFEDERSGESRILAGSEGHGLLASCDGGETWQAGAADSLSGAVNQLHALPGAAGGAAVYALDDAGALRSVDGGRSWERVYAIQGAPSVMLPLGDVMLLGLRGEGVLRIPIR